MKPDAEADQYAVALDKIALAHLMNAVERMKDCLLRKDLAAAAAEADLVYTFLPNSIRKEYPSRPSKLIEERARAQSPEGLILPSPDTRFRTASLFELDAHKAQQRNALGADVLWQFSEWCISQLDAHGLYLGKGGFGFPSPTAGQATVQSPPQSKKYAPGLSREVEG